MCIYKVTGITWEKKTHNRKLGRHLRKPMFCIGLQMFDDDNDNVCVCECVYSVYNDIM